MSTALLALFGALLLALSYLVVGRVVAALPQFPPGIFVDGEPFSYGRLSEKKLRRELDRRRAGGASQR